MKTSLLNENQRRRIGTHLRLLEEDIISLGRQPELARDGAAYDRIRALLDQILRKADALGNALALGPPVVPALRRRVGAVGEIWAVRMEDLTAEQLKGYGTVHPELEATLDRRVSELVSLLEQLAAASTQLPDA